MSEKIDALDLVLNVLKEHEKQMDAIVNRMELLAENFDAVLDKQACEKARRILKVALDDLEE